MFFRETWKITVPVLISFFLFLSSTPLFAQPTDYLCVTAHFTTEKWLQQYKREIDSTGVLIQDKQYHALSIGFWGIMNYHDFKRSGNKNAREQVINQYRYFCDTSKVEISADQKYMGLPYKFKFSDLAAPWYSGMTQGVALSYLYRYYDLTKDKTALVKMKQVAAFMLRMKENGGTLGRTPEGYLWIEEYPNSRNAPQVLNGFINGLIGLAEYLEVFPGDTAAKRVHSESYNALVKTLHKYDTPDWTHYSRTNKRVTNQYMRYEIAQMQHLFVYYGDSTFYRQMMIWSPMAWGKIDSGIKFYTAPLFQFAAPLDTSRQARRIEKPKLFEDRIAPLEKGCRIGKKFYPKSDSLAIKITGKKHPVFDLQTDVRVVCIGFDTLAGDLLPQVLVYNKNGIWKAAQVFLRNKKLYAESVDLFTRFKIITSLKNGSPKVVNYIGVINGEFGLPHFLYYKFKAQHFLLTGKTYGFSCQTEHIAEAKVFYRYAVKKEDMKTAIWKQDQCFDLNGSFSPTTEGYYEFYVCFPFYFPSPTISEIKLVAQ
jgi:D-glucuronyl C5-epimerase C-terminus